MKLLFAIGSALTGGVERITLDTISSLARGGVTCHGIILSWTPGAVDSELERLGIPYIRYKAGWFLRRHPLLSLESLFRFFRARSSIPRFVRQGDWTHVLVAGYRPILTMGPLPHSLRVVYCVHDRVSSDRQFRFFQRFLSKSVWRFVAPSQFIVNDLIHAGISPGQIVRIMNGTRIPAELPKRGNPIFTIGLVGQILPQKGHRVLLEAIAELPRDLPFALRIAGRGEGWFESELRERTEALGLAERVTFLGFVDQAILYDDLDLAVVPSLYEEPFGLVSIEAQAREIPVLVSDAGGLPETIVDGTTGRVFRREQPGELRDLLIWFITHPDEARAMGRRAREHVRDNFSLERTTRELQELLSTSVADV